MANSKNTGKKSKAHDPVESGKKAIEADKKINKQNKPQQQKDKEEKDDAEQWRNEG
jgi:hypothetical protein